MHAMIELAEFHRRDILAEAARYRLADQAVPGESATSADSDIPSLVLRVVHACGRTLAALLATASRPSGLRAEDQEQTTFTATLRRAT
jgi:hypothetical protein